MAKSKDNIQETDTKVKSKKTKKTKVKDEPLESKVSKVAPCNCQVTEPLDDIKVDVEIDLRSYNHSDVVGGYIRRKRSI